MRLIRRFNTILVTAVIITCGCLYNWCVCDPGYRFLGSCYMCAAAKGDTGDTYTLTNADKADIATLVLNQIPVATGVNF